MHSCLSLSYFSVPKNVRLNLTHYLIMKINNKRELQNIAINHSADIDYKDFVKIYRECTKELYYFLTIDTTAPASHPLRLKKICFDLIKMTVTHQLKIIDNNVKANQAQYDLDRLAAKISAYSPGDLRNYEYGTDEDLGYKPSVVEQAKLDYFPLGKVFNKGLVEDGQKEGLLKSVKNIRHKKEELVKAIKDQRIKRTESKKTETENNLIYDP